MIDTRLEIAAGLLVSHSGWDGSCWAEPNSDVYAFDVASPLGSFVERKTQKVVLKPSMETTLLDFQGRLRYTYRQIISRGHRKLLGI